ncbi:MAG: hypothetical protein E6F98_15535 [Actinobacteria bacterium]|nr:MAG: hypothetical protein E6F98_15535 [Actinomycetota bacterium]
MPPRPIWSGSVSFGLVNVPVRMLAATESKELRFHFVDRTDLMPVGYDKVRKDTGERVDPENVVRAFEIEKGRYVPIDPDDLDRLDVELAHAVDICDFVALDEIDPIYFRQAYYLVPQEGAETRRDPPRGHRQGRDSQQAASCVPAPVSGRRPARDDVLRRRGARSAGRRRRRAAAGRGGGDGQDARREPERGVRPGEVRRPLPPRADGAHSREGGRTGASGARTAGGRGRRLDAGAARVRRADEARTALTR